MYAKHCRIGKQEKKKSFLRKSKMYARERTWEAPQKWIDQVGK